jgi:hypothetical protein
MTLTTKRLLYWTPRLLTIAFAIFISVFALDVFGERLPFWRMMLALLIHLVPTFVLIAILALAWRWPWIGGVGFTALGILYAWFLTVRFSRFHWDWLALIGGPAFLVGALFLANWLWRRELREAH